MRILVKELRYSALTQPFLGDLKPYAHQARTLQLVRDAIEQCQTICIENASMTGSGKTLANFAAAILDGVHTCGVYPTNELLMDQYVSLIQKPPTHQYPPFIQKLPLDDISILDSQGLDNISAVMPHIRSHAHSLAWATGEDMRTAVLTNPDVLYLAMYSLYGQMFSNFDMSYGPRAFQHMLNNYPVIAFDEFHLYNPKQIANTAFIMGTVKVLAPEKPHIFIFSSATPQEQFKRYVQRLEIAVHTVTDSPSDMSSAQVVCEPLAVNFLAADLLRWQGGEEIRNNLATILAWADSCTPPARGVFIVDSVYEAKRIASDLRQNYDPTLVGEVHGYMHPEDRAAALLCRLSVGTTTIDVGVDLTGAKTKEFLVCEARSAAQAIQRIGRIGRQGREPDTIKIPNTVWLVVPEYVHQYIEHQQTDGTAMTREELNKLLNDAYLGHENFAAYTQKYSQLEAVSACERILRQQYFADNLPVAEEKLQSLVPMLYAKTAPDNQEQARQSYQKYTKQQYAIWRKFGTEVKNPNSTMKRYYLSDLESFRGGMESDFTVAIYDELDLEIGLTPFKTYGLPFVLRRTHCEELSQKSFHELLRRKHPEKAGEWLDDLERRRVLGYMHVHKLIAGKANECYFEVCKPRDGLPFQQVVRLEGLTMGGAVPLRTAADSINSHLKKIKLNCWISEQESFKLSNALHLPPLFALYPLHAINPGGTHSKWSIAFGLDAFFLECTAPPMRRTNNIRKDGTAIFS